MPDKINNAGFELMRIIINLAAIVVAGGLVALIVATIVYGLG
jgi:hypothetical protein